MGVVDLSKVPSTTTRASGDRHRREPSHQPTSPSFLAAQLRGKPNCGGGGTGVYGTFELVWFKIRFLMVEGGRGKSVFISFSLY